LKAQLLEIKVFHTFSLGDGRIRIRTKNDGSGSGRPKYIRIRIKGQEKRIFFADIENEQIIKRQKDAQTDKTIGTVTKYDERETEKDKIKKSKTERYRRTKEQIQRKPYTKTDKKKYQTERNEKRQ
jgi:hypothetical protein